MSAKKSTATKRKPADIGTLLVPEKLAPLVHYLRHEKVILDSDLAELYGVATKRLNEAVNRNLDRFPADFMFQLTENELEILRSQFATSKNARPSLRSQSATLNAPEPPLRSQIVTLKRGQHRKYLPYVFTEQDQRFQTVFEAVKQLISSPTPPTREIGFHAP